MRLLKTILIMLALAFGASLLALAVSNNSRQSELDRELKRSSDLTDKTVESIRERNKARLQKILSGEKP